MLPLLFVSALLAAAAASQDVNSRRAVHRASPYDGLFTVAPTRGSEVVRLKLQPSGSRHGEVVAKTSHTQDRGPCNMPIMVGDASADPGILIQHRHTTTPRIRVVEAPACRDK